MKLKVGASSCRECESSGLLVESGPLAYRSVWRQGLPWTTWFFSVRDLDFLSSMKVI